MKRHNLEWKFLVQKNEHKETRVFTGTKREAPAYKDYLRMEGFDIISFINSDDPSYA